MNVLHGSERSQIIRFTGHAGQEERGACFVSGIRLTSMSAQHPGYPRQIILLLDLAQVLAVKPPVT